MGFERAQRRSFTADEVLRMVEAGILDEDEPVELIDGELVVMSPQGRTHSALTVRIRRLLEAAFGDAFYVQDHSPIDAGTHSLPEPDLAVVRGEIDLTRHPGASEIVLVVEISVTSQRVDLAKAAVYARAGITEYWNLDVPGRRLTVHRNPRPDGYTLLELKQDADTVDAGGTAVEVSTLLP